MPFDDANVSCTYFRLSNLYQVNSFLFRRKFAAELTLWKASSKTFAILCINVKKIFFCTKGNKELRNLIGEEEDVVKAYDNIVKQKDEAVKYMGKWANTEEPAVQSE